MSKLREIKDSILRRLGPTEEFVVRIQQAAPFCSTANNIACLCRLEPDKYALDPDALRQALAVVARRHPLLRAGIERVGGRLTFVALPAAATIPVEVVQDVEWQTLMEQGLQTQWDVKNPLMQVKFLNYSDRQTQDLIFWVHHAIADGTSLYSVIMDIVKVAAQLMEVGESPALPPVPLLKPIWDYTPKRIDWTQVLAKVSHYIKTPFSPKTVSLPLDTSMPLDTVKTRYCHAFLSSEETAMVLAKARAFNVSVGGLVGAALMLAIPEDGPLDSQKVGLSSIVDLRRRANPPLPFDSLSHCASQVQTYYNIDARTGLHHLAREVQQKVRDVITSGIQWDIGRLLRLALPFLVQHLKTLGPIQFPYSVILSNVGRLAIPERIGNFKISQLRAGADYSFSDGRLFLALATFQGQMMFDWTFNRLKRETVEGYAQRVRNLLLAPC